MISTILTTTLMILAEDDIEEQAEPGVCINTAGLLTARKPRAKKPKRKNPVPVKVRKPTPIEEKDGKQHRLKPQKPLTMAIPFPEERKRQEKNNKKK